jgi:hypothetical protein
MNEEWRTITEFPDYAVSSHGRVKRVVPDFFGRVGKILKPQFDRYAYLTLYRNSQPSVVLVHRIVCKEFHGAAPSPEHQVAHGDGNGINNNKDNLRWATPVENEADKVLHGTNLAGRSSWVPVERRAKGTSHGRHTKPDRTARGERNGTSKLTEGMVTQIRLDNRPRKILAKEYGVTATMIGYIKRGISWAHVPMPRNSGDVA